MAREADVPFDVEREVIDINDPEGAVTRFDVPRIMLDAESLKQVQPDALG